MYLDVAAVDRRAGDRLRRQVREEIHSYIFFRRHTFRKVFSQTFRPLSLYRRLSRTDTHTHTHTHTLTTNVGTGAHVWREEREKSRGQFEFLTFSTLFLELRSFFSPSFFLSFLRARIHLETISRIILIKVHPVKGRGQVTRHPYL